VACAKPGRRAEATSTTRVRFDWPRPWRPRGQKNRGITPGQGVGIDEAVPTPRARTQRAPPCAEARLYLYMDLTRGLRWAVYLWMSAFIGSCTNVASVICAPLRRAGRERWPGGIKALWCLAAEQWPRR